MKNILIIVFVLFMYYVYAVGKVEIPANFTDLGYFEVTPVKTEYSLFLPYVKPTGIIEIPILHTTGLHIQELIIDGKYVRPKQEWGREYYDVWDRKTVGNEESDHLLESGWSLRPYSEDGAKIGLCLWTNFLNRGQPLRYDIPYGTKEVYMTYSIIFPYPLTKCEEVDEIIKKAEKQTYTVKWTITWSELEE